MAAPTSRGGGGGEGGSLYDPPPSGSPPAWDSAADGYDAGPGAGYRGVDPHLIDPPHWALGPRGSHRSRVPALAMGTAGQTASRAMGT